MVITLASCRTRSYLELLTGGKVRYWLSPTKTFLMSFNKETRRCLYYTTEDFKIFYLNGLDVMSNGEYLAQGGLSVAGGCRCLTKELDMIAC